MFNIKDLAYYTSKDIINGVDLYQCSKNTKILCIKIFLIYNKLYMAFNDDIKAKEFLYNVADEADITHEYIDTLIYVTRKTLALRGLKNNTYKRITIFVNKVMGMSENDTFEHYFYIRRNCYSRNKLNKFLSQKWVNNTIYNLPLFNPEILEVMKPTLIKFLTYFYDYIYKIKGVC